MYKHINVFFVLFIILCLNSGFIYGENTKCDINNLSHSKNSTEKVLNSLCSINTITSSYKTKEKELRLNTYNEFKTFSTTSQIIIKNNINNIQIFKYILKTNANLKIPIYINNNSLLF